jgi:hypothetical protein
MPHPVPRNFRSSPEINEKYLAIYRDYEPLLKSKVRVASAAGILEYDDLLQEERIAMLYAVATHDPEKGSLLTWIGWIADNVIRVFLAHALTQGRMPRTWEWSESEGTWVQRKVRPTSLDSTEYELDFGHVDTYDNKGTPDSLIDFETPSSGQERGDDPVYTYPDGTCDPGVKRQRMNKFRWYVKKKLRQGGHDFALKYYEAKLENPKDDILRYIRNTTGRWPTKPSDIKITSVAGFHRIDQKATHRANQILKQISQDVLAERFSLDQIDDLLPEGLEPWDTEVEL